MVRLTRPGRLLVLWIAVWALLIGLSLDQIFPQQGDESYYVVSAAEMVREGQYLVPSFLGQPRFQKPVLNYWLVAGAYRIFGISTWSGRLPALILSILTLILIYGVARWYVPEKEFGLLAVGLLTSTVMWTTYSRLAMNEAVLTFFSTAALACFAQAVRRHGESRWHLIGMAACGGAFMTKGPVGLLPLAAYIVFLFAFRPPEYRQLFVSLAHPSNLLVWVVLVGPWFGYLLLRHGAEFWRQIAGQSRVHAPQFSPLIHLRNIVFYGNVLVLFFFPFSSLAAIKALRTRRPLPRELWLPIVYVAGVVLLFIFAVPRAKDRYLCIVFPWLAVIVAHILYSPGRWRRYLVAAAMTTAACLAVVLLFPRLGGDALRRVAGDWAARGDGTLGTWNLPSKQAGWVMLLTNGQARMMRSDTDYVVTNEEGKGTIQGFAPVSEAREWWKIKWTHGRPLIIRRTFYLMRYVPGTAPG